MCCIFFTLDADGYTLIVASNRDEFLARPTSRSAWHAFPPPSAFAQEPQSASLAKLIDDGQASLQPSASHPILCAIDAHPSGGGTWLGITRTGRWGALTNFTEAAPPPLPANRPGLTEYRSRGQLIKDWLAFEGSLQDYVEKVRLSRDEFPGFNILLGQLPVYHSGAQGSEKAAVVGSMAYVTNRNEAGSDPAEVIRPGQDGMPGGAEFLDVAQQGAVTRDSAGTGVGQYSGQKSSPKAFTGCQPHGLSNSVLHEPWSKVVSGRAAFETAVQAHTSEENLVESLFSVLATSAVPEITSRKDVQANVMVPPLSLPLKPSTARSIAAPAAVASEDTTIPRTNHLSLEAAAPMSSRAVTPIQSATGPQPPSASAGAAKTGWYATRTATVIVVKSASDRQASSELHGPATRALWVERDIHILESDGREDAKPTRLNLDRARQSQRRYEFDVKLPGTA